MRDLRPRPDSTPGRPRFINSGRFTPTLITVLCAAILVVSWERGRGNFHRLTDVVLSPTQVPAHVTGPGGEEVIRLARGASAVTGEPEFVSAELLPGRGMNVFQLTARVPGHGDVPLMASPSLDEANRVLTDSGPDSNGSLSATFGGAFLVPWAGHLVGRPSGNQNTLQTLWLGQHLTFPAASAGSSISTLGLLLARGADSTRTSVLLNGESVEAIFHPGTFSGNWPASGSVRVLAELTGKALDLTVTVQNTGSTPIPMGIGWLPHFNVASHDRAHARLTLPSSTRLEVNHNTGLPTGRMLPVSGSALDFVRARGTNLGDTSIDDTYVRLTTAPLAEGSIAELRDTAWGYGIRIMPITANIKALRVIAPNDQSWVAIGPYTNYEDALGQEWEGTDGSGIATLQPGDSLQWKVRVEIFTFRAGEPSTE